MPIVKRSAYSLHGNRIKVNEIIHGDCLELLKEIATESIDCIITDPPYGVSYKKTGEEYMIGDTVNLFPYFLPECRRVLKPSGAIYVFSSTTKLVETLPVFQMYFKLHSLIIWDKLIGRIPRQLSHYKLRYEPIMYGSKGLHRLNKYADDVIQCQIDRGKKRIHPTQKPEEVIRYLMENSTSEGDIILDPFVGSGTTAVVAKKTKRNFIAFDLNEKYVREIGVPRLNNVEPLFKEAVAVL